ncbi:MAG: glycoside hydrolase family 97 catalytic domain-containing protein [Prolixibacteraceae bacterium]
MNFLNLKSTLPFWLLLLIFSISCTPEKKVLTSPDGTILVTCENTKSYRAVYAISKNGEAVVSSSMLGIIMEGNDFTQKLRLVKSSPIKKVTDGYKMIQGKRKQREYIGYEQTFSFKNNDGNEMQVIFRVSNDGVAFRYYFPGESTEIHKITKEITTFAFSFETRVWMQPMSVAKTGWSRTNPSYEEDYYQNIAAGSYPPQQKGWVFPALLKSGENWVLISETGLDRNYCGSRLNALPNAMYQIGFPESVENFPGGNVNPESKLPWLTPWRVLTIGSLKTITESTLETDLATPQVKGDFSWVKPGKSSWSWVLLKDDSTVYDVQKKYIDYAADMNWQYCLVDADWDQKIGYEKMAELAKYAKDKNVGVNVWYNSSGDWNDTPYTPKSKLLTTADREAEFSKLEKMGVTGVKVDFFGGDGQSMINYYIDLIEAAAKHQLTINFHGCTYPRSWHRTYPNLVTMEAIKGMEFATFVQENADRVPSHGAMLNYTRNATSPMDFTPMALYRLMPTERATTNTYELATSVLFLSGIQHYAERPEGLATVPAEVKEILKHLPAVYDETVFVDGFPGKLTIIARRHGKIWYVAGINGEKMDKEVDLDLSFIKTSTGLFVHESDDPLIMSVDEIQLEPTQKLKLNMKPNGGFLLKFE